LNPGRAALPPRRKRKKETCWTRKRGRCGPEREKEERGPILREEGKKIVSGNIGGRRCAPAGRNEMGEKKRSGLKRGSLYQIGENSASLSPPKEDPCCV